MKKIILLLVVILAGWVGLQAKIDSRQPQRVPAYPGVIETIQPNGDTLHIYIRGDERQHFTMTLDGWQVIERKGYLCYAKQRPNGKIVASCKKAHDEKKRSPNEQRWLQKYGIQKTIVLY